MGVTAAHVRASRGQPVASQAPSGCLSIPGLLEEPGAREMCALSFQKTTSDPRQKVSGKAGAPREASRAWEKVRLGALRPQRATFPVQEWGGGGAGGV